MLGRSEFALRQGFAAQNACTRHQARLAQTIHKEQPMANGIIIIDKPAGWTKLSKKGKALF